VRAADADPTPERQAEIDRRLAVFSRTRHARDLWPDIPVAAFRAAERELARVVAAVLSGAPSPVSLRSPSWPGGRALGVAGFVDGVGALIGFWRENGRVAAEPAVAALFATHLDHGRRRVARLRYELVRVVGALAERRVDVWVLKGMHTGYRYFPEPGTRTSSDIDLLVHPDDWLAACDVLRGLGLVERKHLSQPRDSAWAPPTAQRVPTLQYVHADGPWSIDLHRSLDRLPFEGLETRLRFPDVSAGEVWKEFGPPVRILGQPLLLAYLALHASSHFYGITLIRLIELVLVAQHDFARHPERWEAFGDLVARTRSERFVFPALDLAERLVPGSIDGRVLARIAGAAPRRLRRMVRRMTPASAPRLHPYPALRERFVWLASPWDVLVALLWLAWPREGEKLMTPRKALAAQWRRMRRALRRILQARLPRA
jgi:putative nucleotidyltransferase-like protein